MNGFWFELNEVFTGVGLFSAGIQISLVNCGFFLQIDAVAVVVVLAY